MQRIILATAVIVAGGSGALAGPAEVTPPGRLDLTGSIDVSFSADNVFEPVVLGVDVFYGLQPDLDVGLAHTSGQLTGFLADRDGGLCIGGESGGCPDLYDRPGALARYQLMTGDLSLLGEAGLLIVSISDPFALSLKLGVRARWRSGSFFIDAAPNVLVGITGRTIGEGAAETDFNKERLNLPVDIGVEVGEMIAPFIQLGIAGPLADFVDAFNTPLGAGVRARINDQLEATAWFSFLNVVNREPDLEVDIDLRSGGVMATYRH